MQTLTHEEARRIMNLFLIASTVHFFVIAIYGLLLYCSFIAHVDASADHIVDQLTEAFSSTPQSSDERINEPG